jgi:hypothetical protein
MRVSTLSKAVTAVAVVAELYALYRARANYSRRQLAKIRARPVLRRPNRPGHLVGNLLRFAYRHFHSP